ncbi:hypothetical protein MMC19_007454 [Ptychographa xylographoides]|nr:hypothetical protein [Ptychographa xylographoides]
MSYDGYTYSPYYQSPSHQPVSNNARGPPGQDGPPYYRSTTDTARQRTHPVHPDYSMPTSSGRQDSGYSYRPYELSTNHSDSGNLLARGEAPVNTIPEPTARTNIDTSALGSLAYASALGLNSPATLQNSSGQQRVSATTRTTQPFNGNTANTMSGYSEPRSESRGSGAGFHSTVQNSSTSPYVASIAASATARTQYTGHQDILQTHYRAKQAPNQRSESPGLYAGSSDKGRNQVYQISTQDPASSAQRNYRQIGSSQVSLTREQNSSNSTGPRQYTQQAQGGHNVSWSGTGGSDHYSAKSAHQPQNSPNVSISEDNSIRQGAPGHTKSSSGVGLNQPIDSAQTPSQTPKASASADQAQNSRYHGENLQTDQHASGEQHPTTVNPNQVFNLLEYQRRQAEIETEAARKAEAQAQAAIKLTGNGTHDHQLSGLSHPEPLYVDSRTESNESGDKRQLEAEIRAMIEKMREYKAKDPAAFSEVWEQFKKVQPPTVRASSQAPRLSKEGTDGIPVSNQSLGVTSSSLAKNGPLSRPSPIINQQSSLPPGDPEQLPDLGKFPALRRRREKGKTEESGQVSQVLDPKLWTSSQSAYQENSKSAGVETTRQASQAYHDAPQPVNSSTHRPGPPSSITSHDKSLSSYTTQGHNQPYQSPYDEDKSSQQSHGTRWPKNRKRTLAIVAKTALESDPANSGKRISLDEICTMLDQNPSYNSICKMLEAKGFVLERAAFARQLLSAVPDNMDAAMTPTATSSEKKLRKTPTSDSPKRPRGRPRKDGLPAHQNPDSRLKESASIARSSVTTTPSYTTGTELQSSNAVNYRTAGNPSPTLGGTTGYENLGAALRSAISEIDRQSKQSDDTSSERQAAIAGRPLYVPDEAGMASSRYGNAAIGQQRSTQNPMIGTNNSLASKPTSSLSLAAHPPTSFHDLKLPALNPGSPSITQQSKEQMARKRNFSEIVDLTHDPEEEAVQEQKRARLEELSKTRTLQPNNLEHPAISIRAEQERLDIPGSKSSGTISISSRDRLHSKPLIKDINRSNALKKSAYNAKTLARDILISRGLHPSERPLNWHLESLYTNFRSVYNYSDLSTFDWDRVDPGGPMIRDAVHPGSEVPNGNDEVEKSPDGQTFPFTHGRGRGRGRGRPPRMRGFTRGRPIELSATDFQGDERSLVIRNTQLSRGRGSRSRGTTYLQPRTTHQAMQQGTTSMANIPSFGQSSAKPPVVSPAPTVPPNGPLKASSTVPGDAREAADAPPGPSPAGSFSTSLTVRVPSYTASQVPSAEGSASRRGELPGSASKSVASDIGRSHIASSGETPRRRGRPPGSKNGTPTRGGSSTRGRRGNRNAQIPADGIGVVLPSRSASPSSRISHVESVNEPVRKKKGRPSHQATTPTFQVFKCQWQGCRAELHNLETLRRHLFKLHGRKDGEDTESESEPGNQKIPCLWIGCEQEGIFSSTTGILKFDDMESWKQHVEKRHLADMAWELGDGPSSHPSGRVSQEDPYETR